MATSRRSRSVKEFRPASVVVDGIGSDEQVDLVTCWRTALRGPACRSSIRRCSRVGTGASVRKLDHLQPHSLAAHRGLYACLGFAEFADAAYRRFDEMAQMIVADIHATETGIARGWLDERREHHFPDLRGGKTYIDSPLGTANYVDMATYQRLLAGVSPQARMAGHHRRQL